MRTNVKVNRHKLSTNGSRRPAREHGGADPNIGLNTLIVLRDIVRPYPVAAARPRLPAAIPDEVLNFYGWVFSQGGFLNLGMTFEQFLSVVAAIHPSGLRSSSR